MNDPIHPPAQVSKLGDLRILAQECKSICDRIRRVDRDKLNEFHELGIRLNSAKEIVKRGEWDDWLKQHGIPSQRASEAMRVAAHWDQIPERGDLGLFLKACGELKLCSDPKPPPTVESTDADASDGETEPTTETEEAADTPAETPTETPAEPEPPTPPVPTDAEGEPIPPHVAPAFETAKQITAACRQIDEVVKLSDELAKAPGGRLIRLDSVKQQLKDAKGNLWANRPTHICPYCKANAKKCEACNGEGWTAKHVWQQAPGNSKHAK